MSKYGNKKITLDGILWDSLLEAAFYQRLKDYKASGRIRGFRWKIPYILHGADGVTPLFKYLLDFEIDLYPAKTVLREKFTVPVEAKGMWTTPAKMKRKMFDCEYGPKVGKLEIHTAKEPWKL